MIAVTCDDGSKDYFSSYALDAFRKIGARVTYFTVGKQLVRYGYVLQSSTTRTRFSATTPSSTGAAAAYKTDERRLQEPKDSATWTLALVGEEASLFRAPGGTYGTWVDAGIPMPIIQWSVDTYDYTGKTPKQIFYVFRDKVSEGDIVLCP